MGSRKVRRSVKNIFTNGGKSRVTTWELKTWIFTEEPVTVRLRALRSTRTPEEIKRATMHKTNKAFERYFTLESEDIREIYQETLVPATGKTGTRLVPQKSIIKIPTD